MINIVKYGKHQQDTIMNTDGVCRCICVGSHNNTSCYLKIFDNGKVRKMTTREIGRLMGVDNDDIDKMIESGISSSNINNLFGNSIVVDVMVYMFDNLFNKEKENNNLF